MINQQLLNYVKQLLKEGAPEGDIRKTLLQNGWNDTDINEAFSSLRVPTPTQSMSVPRSPVKPNLSSETENNTQMNTQRQLHPKAVWLFFFNKGFGLWILVAFFLAQSVIYVASGILFLIWSILIFIVVLILAFVVAKLSYHFYRFELTDGEYKAERGIIWKRYISIPYGRIQNVDIYRGVLDRLLGLSDLNIQTAGYSTIGTRGAGGSEGRLPGLSTQEAEKVREELIKRAKGARQGV